MERSAAYWTQPPESADDAEFLCACPVKLVRWLGPDC